MQAKFNINVKDNTGQIKKEFKDKVIKALTECGLVGEGYAKLLCPVDTGNLRNSITCNVVENESAVYIGTNVEYAPYVEFGTYKMAEQPFLKTAVDNYKDSYNKIFKKYFKDGVSLS